MMAFLLDIITFLQISFGLTIILYFVFFNYKRCMKLQILLPS
ncbi:hypothetical protein [Francisella tularensis]|nr:hypothetical protein [Francisella tularensis]